MEAMFGLFLGFLLVFGHHLAEGCTCDRYHPQQYFCHYRFAIKATILSRKVTPSIYGGDLLYRARIDEIFKMEKYNIKDRATVTIRTERQSSLCGETHLQKDRSYVLTGRASAKKLHIGLCGFNKPWDQVTAFQRKAFRYFYKLTCPEEVEEGYSSLECEVSDYGYMSRGLPPSQRCDWSYWDDDCATKYSTCMHQTKGSCEWLLTSAYKDCMGNGNFIYTDPGTTPYTTPYGFVPGTTEEDSVWGSGSGSGYLPSWLSSW